MGTLVHDRTRHTWARTLLPTEPLREANTLSSNSLQATRKRSLHSENVTRWKCLRTIVIWRTTHGEKPSSNWTHPHWIRYQSEIWLSLELMEATNSTPSKWEAFAFIKSLVFREFLILFVIYNFF